jgi:hypothetical protein
MTNGQHRRIYPAVCTALLSFIMAPATYAQEEAAPDVHWAYASFFGTGWYKVSNTSEAFVVRASPRWAIGASDIDDRGNRKFGYTLRVPVTFGLTRFELDDIPGLIDFNNLSTLSVGFGADVDIPVNERFSLRPTAEFGFGSVLGESEHAWTWRTELRSRYMFETDKLDWALLAGIGITYRRCCTGTLDTWNLSTTSNLRRGSLQSTQSRTIGNLALPWANGRNRSASGL